MFHSTLRHWSVFFAWFLLNAGPPMLFGRSANSWFACAQLSGGVTVSTEAQTTYDEFRNEKKYRYVIYEFKNWVVEVDTTGDYSATYADFLEQLQNYETECRYCVVNFPVSTSADSAPSDRVVFISWCPEQAGTRQKLVYGSAKNAVRRNFEGVAKEVDASKLEDVSQEAIQALFQ